MSNLFKKAAIFTDIHFGMRNNSLQHNVDCSNFVDWFVDEAKRQGCETCIFLGDYNHNRATINIQTLQFGLRALEKLNDNFDRVLFLTGNHDLYFRDRRDVHSVEWARHLPNVEVINDWFCEGDVVIAPWLVGEDYKRLPKMQGKYLFGHLELANFYMNAHVIMPEHDGMAASKHFSHFDHVFSGHFHKRQTRGNITYIGNAFPHNFADAGDDARGLTVLEWGQPTQYFAWPDQPVFRTLLLSQVLENQNLLVPNSHCRVHLDYEISYEEAAYMKEKLIPEFNLRELNLLPMKLQDATDELVADIKFESVDQIVMDSIAEMQEGDALDKQLLLEIYRTL